MSQTDFLKGRLASSSISPLFVDRFGRSLRFCPLYFEYDANSDDFRSNNPGIGKGF